MIFKFFLSNPFFKKKAFMKRLKVFHGLVNYGTQSGFFARELRNQGIEALSLTYPDSFKRQTDVELKHGGNILQKILRHCWNYLFVSYCFFKYNTFHFYFGKTLLPDQKDLRFYRFFGKKVIMEYLGSDCQLYQQSLDTYKWTNMIAFSPSDGAKRDEMIRQRMKREQTYIDINLVCSPIYSEFVPDSIYVPLAIDLKDFVYSPVPEITDGIRIMHAPTSRGYKGTAYIIEALERIKSEGYPIHIDLVEGVTHKELIERYKQSHIFIDQILAGGYGTASIEAMALGRPVIAFIRPEFMAQYGEGLPIISANPDTIYEVLKDVLDHKISELNEIGNKSRLFIENGNSIESITKRLIEIYKR